MSLRRKWDVVERKNDSRRGDCNQEGIESRETGGRIRRG